MKDVDKSREQLIQELSEIRSKLKTIEYSWSSFEEAMEKLLSFEKALETMQMGVTITDLKGKILYINPADLKMHGYEPGELIDKNVGIFAPGRSRKPMDMEKIKSMKRWKRQSVNVRKDGSTFPVQLMSDLIKDTDGNPLCVVTTCEDITEREKMEKELKERIEELERFYEASIHREVKMKKLKEEISDLKSELSKNRP